MALAACALIATSFARGRAYAEGLEQWLPSQPLLEGQRMFQDKQCSGCHGIPGQPDSARSAPDLSRGRSWSDVMQLASSLWNHAPKMITLMRDSGIARPTLSPDEMGKVVTYLFSLSFLDEPGDATRGKAVFENRTCSRCHQLGGRGGTVGPRLDELKEYVSSVFLAQALWNHGPEMAAKMTELGLQRPRLEGDDVGNIVAFIRGGDRSAVPLAQVSAAVGDARVGKSLFHEKGCIKCHAVGGEGGTVGPDLGRHQALRNVSEMTAAFWNHGPMMWETMRSQGISFAKLSDRDMADLMAYLYFVQYMGGAGDPAKGGSIFRDKGCSRCHADAGNDKATAPRLTGSSALRSPIHWASAMWNHAPTVDNAMREMKLEWPAFADDEMRDMVAFLRSRDGTGSAAVPRQQAGDVPHPDGDRHE